MALENPYCTVSQLRSYIRNYDTKLVKTDGSDTLTPVLESSINSASRFIDKWMGRDYFFHDHSVTPIKLYMNSDEVNEKSKTVVLPYSPIITLTSVTYSTTTYTEGTDFYVEDDMLQFFSDFPFPYNQIGRPRVLGTINGFGTYSDPIEIVGTFGYTQAASTDVPTGIPADVSHACIVAAAAMSGNYQKEVVGIGSVSQIYSTDLEGIFYKILGPRRVGWVM